VSAARGGPPTPALVVDAAAAERNQAMAVSLLGKGQVLRPHFKAHKTTALARMQLAGGVTGFCCQTSWEALAMARAGFDDIMLTNQVVDPTALAELVEAAKLARLSALVDAGEHVDLLARAAKSAGRAIGVLIEVETGMKRCGVEADSDALLLLAEAIAGAPGLIFDGVQAYDGHVAGTADPVARRVAAARSAAIAQTAVDRLTAMGMKPRIVAGLSTAHMPFCAELDVWTDVQAGSYLLMDGIYSGYGDLPFERALMLEGTVIHASTGRFVINGGLKQFAADRGPPQWVGDMAAPARLSDEHCVVAAENHGLAIGDRARLQPRHLDPTINMHAALWLERDGAFERVAVDGRRTAEFEAGAI
jgi:D-serine deaminase-like pyridoxal phosphate-dependent protein